MKCDTIPDLERFLAIQEQALGPACPEVARTLSKLAELYFETGDSAKAESLYHRSFEILSGLHAWNRQGIEETEQRLKQIRAAKSAALPAAAGTAAPREPGVEPATSSPQSTGEHLPPTPRQIAKESQQITLQNLEPPSSTSLNGLNSSRAVNAAIQEAELELALLKQMVGHEHPTVADMLTKIADFYCRLKMYGKMEPLLVEALKIRESCCGPEHPGVSTELKNLGTLYCVQERFALAEPLLKRAISLRERAFGRSHPRVADVEAQYALLLRKTNRGAQAEALERHVNEIRNSDESTPFSCDSSFFGAAKPRR